MQATMHDWTEVHPRLYEAIRINALCIDMHRLAQPRMYFSPVMLKALTEQDRGMVELDNRCQHDTGASSCAELKHAARRTRATGLCLPAVLATAESASG